MRCDVCQTNEASVFLTQIVAGKMQKVNLCADCAKAKGVDDPAGFALTDLLMGMGSTAELEKPAPLGGSAGLSVTVSASGAGEGGGVLLRCPTCGFTQADFKKTQRMGCSDCYETFGELIAGPLKQNHKGTHHTGKAPARQFRRAELGERMKTLQGDLSRAVKEEDYEGAAQLRDAIRRLEDQLKAPA